MSLGKALLAVAGVGGAFWLLSGPSDPSAAATGSTPTGSTKPAPTYTPTPTTTPLEPELVTVGRWCSATGSKGAPPELDAAIESYVRADPNARIPALWLQLSLYVQGFTDSLPTLASITDSVDRTNEFDTRTAKALAVALPGFPQDDKERVYIEAFRLFARRDAAVDRPCPFSVAADIAEMLSNFACAAAEVSGEQAQYPCSGR